MGDGRLGTHFLVLDPVLARQARVRRGISQAKLAQQLGVTQGTVSAWEAGRKHPAMDGLVRTMARILGVPVSAITTYDEEVAS